MKIRLILGVVLAIVVVGLGLLLQVAHPEITPVAVLAAVMLLQAAYEEYSDPSRR